MSPPIISTVAIALLLTTTTSISQINNSNIIQGDNNNITNNKTTKNYYTVQPRKENSELLKLLTGYATNNHAERALKSKKYRLAAEIYEEAYEIALVKKTPKRELISMLSNKSIAEGYFDKIASYNTLLQALQHDKHNLTLHEAAANTAIDNYQFDNAKKHLNHILNSQIVINEPQKNRKIRYEANHKLHAISALEQRVDESINYAIICSKIYRTELNEDEQLDSKLNQVVMLQVAVSAAVTLTQIPENLVIEYLAVHRIISPNRHPTLLGTDKDNIWLSTDKNRVIRVETDKGFEKYNVFRDIQEAPEYVLGTSIESITKLLSQSTKENEDIKNYSERDMLRHFLSLQESLIELAGKCKECQINPIATTVASMMLGFVHEKYSDYDSAHFYYALALRKYLKANVYIQTTPHYRFTLAELYKKIGIARTQTIGGIGGLANEDALLSPFRIALKTIEGLVSEQPNNTTFIAKEIELKNLYSNALITTFNFEEVKTQCTSSIKLFGRLESNPYATDNETTASYLGCTRTLLTLYKSDNDQIKYDIIRNQFINSIKTSNPFLDPELLLGGL